MPVFRCKVSDAAGKITELVREAQSEEALSRELSGKGMYPLKIFLEKNTNTESKLKSRFPLRTIIDFTQTTSILISSGLSLKDALNVAQTIFTKGNESTLINHISEKLDKGTSFYKIIDGLDTTFPPIYRGLVRIGEKIGSLDMIFTRLSVYLTNNKKIREKITGALVYPLMILSLLVVGAIAMTFFVFPQLGEVFSSFGSDAVGSIQERLIIYNVIMGLFAGVAVVFLALIVLLRILRKQENPFAESIDALFLKIPIIGKSMLYSESMNFLFAMDALTSSGYAVEEALFESAFVLKNKALKKTVMNIRDKIMKGDALSDAFYEQNLFPKRIAQWIVIGERSGKVETVFSQLCTYYQDEIEKWSTRIAAWIEPMLIIFVGLFLITFVILFILPIFSMYSTVNK